MLSNSIIYDTSCLSGRIKRHWLDLNPHMARTRGLQRTWQVLRFGTKDEYHLHGFSGISTVAAVDSLLSTILTAYSDANNRKTGSGSFRLSLERSMKLYGKIFPAS